MLKITLKIKEGTSPQFLMTQERRGELFEDRGVRLFLCQPYVTMPHYRVYCAKTGLAFSDLSETATDALQSVSFKFRAYGRDIILRLIEEGCKDGGFINEEALSTVKTLKVETVKPKNKIDRKSRI